MNAREIREARRRLGWSQAELSRRVGVSQPMISNVERGFRTPGPALQRKFQSVLLRSRDGERGPVRPRLREESPAPLLNRAAPKTLSPGGRPSVVVDRWSRPVEGGDAHAVMALGEDALLVAGIDVAGHGRRLLPPAQYLLGWLSGRCRALGGVPSLPSLAADLTDELNATQLRAGFFLATIEGLGDGVRDILYTGLACSYPAPLLITTPPYRSHTAIVDPALSSGGMHVPLQVRLEAPWRLLVFSDGLLGRLGDGNEEAGRRKLVRWQRGIKCDEPLDSFLDTEVELADDESALRIRSSAWDEVFELEVEDSSSRHRIVRTISRDARRSLGEVGASEVGQVVLEALTNVRDRAYDGRGKATVRVLTGAQTFRVQIEDEGRDQVTPDIVESSRGGFLIMRRCMGDLFVRRNYPRGTIVTMVYPIKESGNLR